MTLHPLLSLLLTFSVTDVRVTLQDGTERAGQIIQIRQQLMTIQTGAGKQDLSRNQLTSVVFPKSANGEFEPAAVTVVPTDGSKLMANSYYVKNETAQIELLNGTSLSLPTKLIRYVRFSKPQKKLDDQWNELKEQKHIGDVIVIRRPDDVIDYLEGVLGEAGDSTVAFEYDGEWVDVKREKVDGFVYFHGKEPTIPPAICVLTTVDNSTLNVENLSLDSGTLRVQTTNGASLEFPIDWVRELDYSTGNSEYLSDLPIESYQWDPYIPLPAVAKELEELNRPRADLSLFGKPLGLAMQKNGKEIREFAKGVAIHSKTEMIYRIAGKYRRFEAVAGIDHGVLPGGNVDLIIEGDGRRLLERTIQGVDAALKIELDVTGVKRLKIVVGYGEGADLGDHLNLCDARLSK